MRLPINLASDEYARARRQWRWASLALAAALVLTAGHVWVAWALLSARPSAAGRIARLGEEVARLEGQSVGPGRPLSGPLGPDKSKALGTRVARYNRILEAAAFSWSGLLSEFERAVPPDVALVTIQPDVGASTVTVQGLARRFDDVGALLRALEERPAFREVFLLHQAERKGQGGAASGLEFTIAMRYRGRG